MSGAGRRKVNDLDAVRAEFTWKAWSELASLSLGMTPKELSDAKRAWRGGVSPRDYRRELAKAGGA